MHFELKNRKINWVMFAHSMLLLFLVSVVEVTLMFGSDRTTFLFLPGKEEHSILCIRWR